MPADVQTNRATHTHPHPHPPTTEGTHAQHTTLGPSDLPPAHPGRLGLVRNEPRRKRSAKAPDEGRGPPKKRGREKKTPPVVEVAEPEKVVEKPPQDDDETEDEDEGAAAAAAVKAGRGKR